MCDKLRCISCSKILNKDCGKSIDGTLLEIVGVLFENSRLEFNVGSKICENCQNSLLVGFKFKAMCVHTEDKLHPYISQMTESKERIDLKMVMANLRGTQYENAIAVNICRLCLALVDENDKQLFVEVLRKNDWEDTFKFYIPDMNLEVTEDPIICKSCLCSLEEFMANSLEFAPFKSIISDGYLENCQIQSQLDDKSKDVQEKQSDVLEYANSSATADILKSFEQISRSGFYRCQICSKQTKLIQSILKHMHSHAEIWFNCKTCPYKTKYKKNLYNHENNHELGGMYLKVYKCGKCDFRAQYKYRIRNHERTHTNDGEIFKCSVCDFRSRSKRSVKLHELRHSNRIYKCDLCPHQTNDPGYLKRHKRRKHLDISNAKTFACNLCSYKTLIKDDFNRHIITHKSDSEVETFTCYHCGFETRHKHYLQEHIRVTHMNIPDEELFKCKLCDYVAKQKSCLMGHMVARHFSESEITMHKCSQCPFQTKYIKSLNNHINTIHDVTVTVFSCDQCSFKTKYIPSLGRHRQVKHNNMVGMKLHRCESCTYMTIYRENLTRHMKKHKDSNEISKLECPLCDFTCYFPYQLKSHADLWHSSNVEILKCKSCPFSTKSRRTLNSHMRKHRDISEMETFQCDKCAYKTTVKGSLKEHVLVHRSDAEVKMYKCPDCSYQTKFKANIGKHANVHSDRFEKCDQCDFKTKYPRTLQKHYSLFHE